MTDVVSICPLSDWGQSEVGLVGKSAKQSEVEEGGKSDQVAK